MADLRDRFALADQLAVPELSGRVAAKAEELTRGRETSAGRKGHSRIIAATVASLVFIAAGVFVWDAFSKSGHAPAIQAPPGAVELPGVPFAVCRPMSIPGSFGAGLDTEWVFGRASETGCAVVDVRYVGVGTPDGVAVLSAPLLQDDLRGADLWPFAAADVNGDRIDEIAIGANSGGTPTRFALFRLDGTRIVRIAWCPHCGALVDWGGPGGHIGGAFQGAFCQQHDGSPVFSTWDVESSDDRTRLTGWLIDYSLEGSRFKEVARKVIDVPAKRVDLLPPGGESTLCGSPVHSAHEFG